MCLIAEWGAPERTRTPTVGLYNFARTDVVVWTVQ